MQTTTAPARSTSARATTILAVHAPMVDTETHSAITAFTGPFAFLANDYPFVFEFEAWGRTHTALSVDHAFQAMKAGTLDGCLDILASPTAEAAWAKGRQVELRGDWSDWDDVKLALMHELVGRKFADEQLALRLEETGSVPLIAGNTWHDGYWGVCTCGACPAGANALGVVLMQVREGRR